MKLTDISTLTVASNVIKNKGYIPAAYTCDGINVSPALSLDGIPDDTVSLAIVVDDPDAPRGTFTHWLIWNIKPVTSIKENAHGIGVEGVNDFGKAGYMGPCPPNGTHRYLFKVYALDSMLDVNPFSRKDALLSAIENRILGYGELVGLYTKGD